VDICRQHLTLYLVHLRLLNILWSLVGVVVVFLVVVAVAQVVCFKPQDML
jgi:hypothetical protein